MKYSVILIFVSNFFLAGCMFMPQAQPQSPPQPVIQLDVYREIVVVDSLFSHHEYQAVARKLEEYNASNDGGSFVKRMVHESNKTAVALLVGALSSNDEKLAFQTLQSVSSEVFDPEIKRKMDLFRTMMLYLDSSSKFVNCVSVADRNESNYKSSKEECREYLTNMPAEVADYVLSGF